MVLILSNSMDTTTGRVINHLHFNYGLECIRINELSVKSMPNFRIEINNKNGTSVFVNDSEIGFIWNRKSPEIIIPDTKFIELEAFYRSEYNALLSFLDLVRTSKIKNLGSVYYNPDDINKLHALNVATQMGLKIPSTVVVNNKKDFQNFSKKHSKCITKTIHSVTVTNDEKNKIRKKMLTSIVTSKEEIGDFFLYHSSKKKSKKKLKSELFTYVVNFIL